MSIWDIPYKKLTKRQRLWVENAVKETRKSPHEECRSFTKNKNKHHRPAITFKIGNPPSFGSHAQFWVEFRTEEPYLVLVYDDGDSPNTRRYFVVDLEAGTVLWRHRTRKSMVEVLNRCDGLHDFDNRFPGDGPRHVRALAAVREYLSRL